MQGQLAKRVNVSLKRKFVENMRFEDVYEVKELLGKGSFAEVKKCVNRRTSQLFAVKEIHYKDAEEREKIEQESEVKLLYSFLLYTFSLTQGATTN